MHSPQQPQQPQQQKQKNQEQQQQQQSKSPWKPAGATQSVQSKGKVVQPKPKMDDEKDKKQHKEDYVSFDDKTRVRYPTTSVATATLESVFDTLYTPMISRLPDETTQKKRTRSDINPLFGEIKIQGMRTLCASMNACTGHLFADMGCGYGRQALFMFLEHPYVSVYGIEYDPDRFTVARRALAKLWAYNPSLFEHLNPTEYDFRIRLRSRIYGNVICLERGNLLDKVSAFENADILFCEVSFKNTGQYPLLSKRLSQMKPNAKLLLYEQMETIYGSATMPFQPLCQLVHVATTWSPYMTFGLWRRCVAVKDQK